MRNKGKQAKLETNTHFFFLHFMCGFVCVYVCEIFFIREPGRRFSLCMNFVKLEAKAFETEEIQNLEFPLAY